MEIQVSLAGDLRVDAHFNGFTVHTDQPKAVGGGGEHPDPFSYFLAGLASCAGFFVAKFCQSRDLPTEGIALSLSNTWDKERGLADSIHIEITLPESFPAKYHKALTRVVNECSVKKTLLAQPEMTVSTVTQ